MERIRMRSGRGRRLRYGAAVLVFALTSGCTVEILPPTSSAPSSSIPSPTNSSSESAPADDPYADARRSTYEGTYTVTLDCAGGKLVLDQPDQVVRVTGTCQRLTVTANDVVVVADDVVDLIVADGADWGCILVRSAVSVQVDSDDTDVWWDQGTPRAKVTGIDSTANPNPVRE